MCDDGAMSEIRQRISEHGIGADEIHFIDNGNYHYMSAITLEMVKEPFSLVVFDHHPDMQLLGQPVVWGNLVYLGLICSLAAYFIWGITVKRIGAVRASNYFYLSPIISMISAAIWFGERANAIAYIGCVLIMGGVIIAEKFKRTPEPANQ